MGNKILPSNTRLGCFWNRQRKCINNLLGAEDKKAVKSRRINLKESAVSAAKTARVPAQMLLYCVAKLLESIVFFLFVPFTII
ncbi:hypothetical protein N7471_013848 [Penicillium samsonianum]|uniref:uncharacterized protein n=1 Tax=Penicillium samsonianum TaxID=1882272 RepID=UPI0025496ECC|nr:uncharacterized protein N7471_013848 [Penicillium samsonianum]KAJ6118381.1 hypothetical protein N7471_013848 [Penicillium samsonianum]